MKHSAHYGIKRGVSERILELIVDLGLLLNDSGEVPRKEGSL